MPKHTKAHTRYTVGDKIVPGVTSIIGQGLGWNKNALVAWARREGLKGNDPNKIKQYAADVGTLAHYLIECWLTGKTADLLDYTERQKQMAQPAFEQFKKWWNNESFSLLSSEMEMTSTNLQYGGTIDILAEHEGKFALVDIKTSSGVYPEHKIQLAAYWKLLTEHKYDISEWHIIQLPKTKSAFHHHRFSKSEMDVAFDVFKHLLAIYDLRKQL